MRYQITVSGTLDTWADEATIRRDAPGFLRDVEEVHSGIVAGSVALVSVEALPEPEPTPEPVSDDQATDPTAAILAALNGITARLDKAGL